MISGAAPMISKEQLVASMCDEMRIVRHLARKVPAHALGWRPTPGQRSTIELLRYLSTAAIDLAREVASGEWDVTRVTGKAPTRLREEDFDAAMARQEKDLRELLAPFDDRAMAERRAILPTGAATTLGHALLEVVLKALVGYRMQLFLYAKASGNASLTTLDCWFGVESPAAR